MVIWAHRAAASSTIAALGSAPLDAASLYRLAQASEITGDRQGALTLLERALAAGYSLDELQHDPELTKVRADVRYHQMLARRGLSEQAPVVRAPSR